MRASIRNLLARPHAGQIEIAALIGLYGVYELVRGLGGGSFAAAYRHTAEIVSLEQSLHLYGEKAIQDFVQGVPVLPAMLGIAYIALHLLGTTLALIWVYRSRRERFALVRTSLVVTTAISLAIYVVFPAAPPRLAGLGFSDTVTTHAHLNLSSDMLGSLYNPIAAVPSLHFGYALLVGVVLFSFARGRTTRLVGAAYPAVMLFVIVATGNHFIFDAAAGAAVTIAGWAVARVLVQPRSPAVARRRASVAAA
jgi:hypothetical protein